jgi:hypothetical protein
MTAVAYVGNFRPAHSTENHVAEAFERAAGCDVIRLQEDDPEAWRLLRFLSVDLVVWTHTWSFDVAAPSLDSLRDQRERGVPVVGFHLDRLWGLDRERLIRSHPFFSATTMLVTADGGHDADWAEVGIDHRWLPPGVSAVEAGELGRPRSSYAHDVVFVGSHAGYHHEWPWRPFLVGRLARRYGRRFRAYPMPGRPALRGEALADLYRSAKVIVGDSCLAGGVARYWSDRIPETVGRGGYLIHPNAPGLEECFTVGEHLDTFDLDDDYEGSFARLCDVIDSALGDPDRRERIRQAGRAHVLARHTYDQRVVSILDLAGVA